MALLLLLFLLPICAVSPSSPMAWARAATTKLKEAGQTIKKWKYSLKERLGRRGMKKRFKEMPKLEAELAKNSLIINADPPIVADVNVLAGSKCGERPNSVRGPSCGGARGV